MNQGRWLVIALLFAALSNRARADYYVSASGSDTALGTSEATAWRTLARVDMATLPAGSIVRFRRGDTFAGSLTITESGTASMPIVLSTYGTGAAPVLTGLVDITAWRALGGGIYEATLPAPRTTMLNVVMMGDRIVPIGRYPRVTGPDSGYLFFESRSGTTSITDTDLTGTPSFVGAELVIRTEQHVFNRGVSAGATAAERVGVITTHTGGTLTFPAFPDTGTYPLRNGAPYFLQNHAACLLQDGDWLFDRAANVIRMRSASMPTGVRVAAFDRIVWLNGASHIRIEDLAFLGGNDRAVSSTNGANITVTRSTFRASGNFAMTFDNTDNVAVSSCTVSDSLSNAIRFNGATRAGFTATDNIIERTAMIAGMGEAARNTYQGIQVRVRDGATLERNVIRDTGYNAIYFQGSNITIRNNVIERFCAVLDDGGGIYTWNGPATPFTGRVIEGNIVRDGVGLRVGAYDTSLAASGIYLDLNPSNVRVLNNTVYRMPNRGITANNPQSIEVRGNTVLDTETNLRITKWAGGQTISGFTSTDNIFVTRTNTQRNFSFQDQVASAATIESRLTSIGTFNANFVGGWAALPYNVVYTIPGTPSDTTVFPDDFHLPAWRTFSGFETTSRALPEIARHRIDSVTGTELVTSGTFPMSVVDAMPAPRRWALVVARLGPVTAGHTYRVRTHIRSGVSNGAIEAFFRNAPAPYAPISPSIVHPVTMGTELHEFLIVPDTSSASAAWVFRIMASPTPLFIDDLSIVEVMGQTLTFDDSVRLEVNDTNVVATRALDAVYTDARGAVRDRSVTLMPYTSAVLFRGGMIVPTDAGMPDAGALSDAGVDAATSDLDAALEDGGVLLDAAAPDASLDGGVQPDAQTLSDARANDDAGPMSVAPSCGCRAGTSPTSWSVHGLLAALALLLLRRARR